MNLNDLICEQLQHAKRISFADFMQWVLYAPNLGYYSAGMQKFGEEGDFITAPELTPLFGYTLANQCQQILRELNDPILFEFGAGSGLLCVDLMMHLERLDCLPSAYHILEVSGDLRLRQEEKIKQSIPHLAHKVVWLSSWPQVPFQGVVIANEVLDAMPVHRFLQTETALLEGVVTLDESGKLVEAFQPCVNPRLQAHVDKVLQKNVFPYQSEVNLFIDDWLVQCNAMLTKGVLLICDYGFPEHEYYHASRNMGTLMCHHRHRAHTNPLIHLGEQDITAHVDFTHVAEAGFAAGFTVAGFTNQASFLLSNGLLDLLVDSVDETALVRAKNAVKQLLSPSEMGELFKVIALTKHIDVPLTGFQLQDKRASL